MDTNKESLTYGEFIKELRAKNKLSQKDLASKLSLSFQTISKYENNQLKIDINLIGKLCKIFNVDVTSFLNKEDKLENNFATNHEFNYSKFLLTLSYYKEKYMISWKDLAFKTNIPISRISKIENNEALIRIDEFIKLADFFNVDYTYFYFSINPNEVNISNEGILTTNNKNLENNEEDNKKKNLNILTLIKKHPIYTSLISLVIIFTILLSSILPLTLNKPLISFSYITNEDNTITITGISSFNFNKIEELTIPSKIDNKDVYMIDSYAIKSLNNLKRVNIEEDIKIIKSFAFYNLKSLIEINLPSSLINYQTFAFNITPNLERINLDKDNIYYKVIDNDLYSYDLKVLFKVSNKENINHYNIKEGVEEIYTGAFDSLSNLEEISFSSSVKSVGSNAFIYLSNLKDISFNEGLKSLSFASFLNCNNKEFTSISLPLSLSSLDGNPFLLMPNIKSISVNKDNKYFKVNDNSYLTSLDNITLYSLFNECTSLKRLVLPSNINTLTKGSIDSLDSSIKELVIPSTISNADKYSIEHSSYLDYIYIEKGASNFKEDSIINMDKDLIVGLEDSSLPSSFDPNFYKGKIEFNVNIPSTL